MFSKQIKLVTMFFILFFSSFFMMENVFAKQITCTYSGNIDGVGDFNLSIGLTDKGKLFSEASYESNSCTPGDTVCEDKTSGQVDKNEFNDIEMENKVKAELFSKDGDLITKCPTLYVNSIAEKKYHVGAFNVKQLVSSKTILYLGSSKDEVKISSKNSSKTDDKGFLIKTEVGGASKLKLAGQVLNRKDNFYLNSNLTNETIPITCKYKSEDGTKSFTLKTANNKTWVQSVNLNNAKITNFKDQGQIPGDACVKDMYAKCSDKTCTVSKDKQGSFNIHLTYEGKLTEIGDSSLDGSFLGKVDGCDMLGSLGVLANQFFKILQAISICLLIVMGMKDFANAFASGESDALKKAFNSFVKRILVVILLFLLPVLINWLLEQVQLANNCVIEISK